jgi:hypothetical protein
LELRVTAKKRITKKNRSDAARAWDEAVALYRAPMDRDAAAKAFMKALRIAERDDEQKLRHDSEVTLLVIESGGTAAARRRGVAHWLAFAKRRLRRGESLAGLAEMMHALGMERAPPAIAKRFARAWANERLDAVVEDDDRRAGPLSAARAAYRRGASLDAIAPARDVDRTHRTAATRESARVLALAALARVHKPDVALLRDTITQWTQLAARGRKVWMFDWRSLAALAILSGLDDAAALHALAKAWRAADPTFAATALLPPRRRVTKARKNP